MIRAPRAGDCSAAAQSQPLSVRATRPRSRVREARRWLDLSSVFTLNGLPRDRWPGQRLLTLTERLVIHAEALRRMERQDPELFGAVERVMAERNAQFHAPHADWKALGAVSMARIGRLRRGWPADASERPPSIARPRQVYWKFGTAKIPPTAEVAERQTR